VIGESSTKKSRAPSIGGLLAAAKLGAGRFGVCTKYTISASDRAVPVPDWAGFRMFPRESSVCGGGNAVRVPPRARVFPVQGLVGP